MPCHVMPCHAIPYHSMCAGQVFSDAIWPFFWTHPWAHGPWCGLVAEPSDERFMVRECPPCRDGDGGGFLWWGFPVNSGMVDVGLIRLQLLIEIDWSKGVGLIYPFSMVPIAWSLIDTIWPMDQPLGREEDFQHSCWVEGCKFDIPRVGLRF